MSAVTHPAAAPIRPIEIRRAVPDDAGAISAVLREAFLPFEPLYTPAAFRATAINGTEVAERMRQGPVWVALLAGAPVGTASALATTGGCYIRGMAVVPSARGRRIGWRLLQSIETWAREAGHQRLYLSTTPFLDRALRLYETHGFSRADGGPSDLFGTPLFTMEKALDP